MSPLLDRDGRVLGRLNLVDAALIFFAVILVPIGYPRSSCSARRRRGSPRSNRRS